MTLRRNILLFHQGALGDFVLTWPIALALARIHPQSRIFYVTHAEKGALAGRTLGVEWADAEAGWHTLFGNGDPDLSELPRRLIAGAHSVVSFISSQDGPFVSNLKHVAPEANILTIAPTPPEDYAGHATDFQLEQLRAWPAAHAAAEQILRSVQARGLTAARAGVAGSAGSMIVHPGSGSPTKNWPTHRFIELTRALRDAGCPVRILLGEVEQQRWPADVHRQIQAEAPVVRPTTLLDLMSELIGAAAFVGNDSGPGHLAGILGVPTLTLFGPTDPARWRPIGPRVETIRAEPLDTLGVDAVLERTRILLG